MRIAGQCCVTLGLASWSGMWCPLTGTSWIRLGWDCLGFYVLLLLLLFLLLLVLLALQVVSDYDMRESLVHQTLWSGGSESITFNKLEEVGSPASAPLVSAPVHVTAPVPVHTPAPTPLPQVAMQDQPRTPVLGAGITQALDSRLIGRNYLTSRWG